MRFRRITAYIDDDVVYSHSWEQHVDQTVNLMKSEFGHVKVAFLGHVVGQGQFAPVTTKTKAISSFPVPADKKELTRFLGMAGYYCKFCHNFSTLTEPLTVLLRKGEMFSWLITYEETFDKINSILFSKPVLMGPSLRNHLVCLCLQVWVLSCCEKMPTF